MFIRQLTISTHRHIKRYTCVYIIEHLCLFIFHLLTLPNDLIMADSATSKLLVSDFASSASHIPLNYVRPISDRPNLSEVESSGDSIPLIDLRELHGPNRAEIVHQLANACSTYGFFQVTPRLVLLCCKFTLFPCNTLHLLCFKLTLFLALFQIFLFIYVLDQESWST